MLLRLAPEGAQQNVPTMVLGDCGSREDILRSRRLIADTLASCSRNHPDLVSFVLFENGEQLFRFETPQKDSSLRPPHTALCPYDDDWSSGTTTKFWRWRPQQRVERLRHVA